MFLPENRWPLTSPGPHASCHGPPLVCPSTRHSLTPEARSTLASKHEPSISRGQLAANSVLLERIFQKLLNVRLPRALWIFAQKLSGKQEASPYGKELHRIGVVEVRGGAFARIIVGVMHRHHVQRKGRPGVGNPPGVLKLDERATALAAKQEVLQSLIFDSGA